MVAFVCGLYGTERSIQKQRNLQCSIAAVSNGLFLLTFWVNNCSFLHYSVKLSYNPDCPPDHLIHLTSFGIVDNHGLIFEQSGL